MVNASFKKYPSYQDFVTDVLFNVMDEGVVTIICNYADYQGLIATLNEKVLNGNSLYLDIESADSFDEDIATAQMNDGNMMVSIFSSGKITGEPVVFQTAEAFAPCVYYIEYDARSAVDYPLTGTIIPFQIEQKYRINY